MPHSPQTEERHPCSKPITSGISTDLFGSLTDHQRRALVKLMARIAEQSYRRGAQQGAHFAQNHPERLPREMWHWRYGASLDRSPWLGDPRTEPSIERLLMECGGLQEIGFWCESLPHNPLSR